MFCVHTFVRRKKSFSRKLHVTTVNLLQNIYFSGSHEMRGCNLRTFKQYCNHFMESLSLIFLNEQLGLPDSCDKTWALTQNFMYVVQNVKLYLCIDIKFLFVQERSCQNVLG